jgi:hypothetical protein
LLVNAELPHIFQFASEHPQGKHVRKNVHEAAVHEHVRNDLKRFEHFRCEEVEPEEIDKIKRGGGLRHDGGQKHEPVDDHEVLYYRRQNAEPGRAVLLHAREGRAAKGESHTFKANG